MSTLQPSAPVPQDNQLTGRQKLARLLQFLRRKPELRPCRYCQSLCPVDAMFRGPIYGEFCSAHCRYQYWIKAEW